MNREEHRQFQSVRQKVAAYIREYLKEDCGHKSYEGTWELLESYPSYFEDETATSRPDFYRITLHCYVLGPDRHYNWDGRTWAEAFKKCERDIAQWTNDFFREDTA